jgi:hypothetical protein
VSHRPTAAIAAALAAALAFPAIAPAQDYPEPSKPKGQTGKPKGPGKTLRVSKKRGAKYRTIQSAVNAAKAGDTVRVANGTYREGVIIRGASKRYLKVIGNATDPQKVVIEAKGLKGAKAQNGFLVNGADEVTIRGFKARNQRGNGFFVVNTKGYTLSKLIAEKTGVYGIYAFNTVGGRMSDSIGYYTNDAGFYIGQTPPQTRPVRTIVSNVQSWGNVIGFSGTNMRYVTITKSRFFNNGVGIVPNALDSEKYPPDESNVIRDNDVFWNNFNYFKGAPFPLRKNATGEIAYPVGTGVLLFGGRDNLVESNRIFGHYLVGFGALKQILLKARDAADLRGNRVMNNAFGKNGTDRNGRDMFYDGNGSGNCFAGNTGVQATVPEAGGTFAPCPFTGENAFDGEAQGRVIGWAIAPDREAQWLKHPHAPVSGITPLETWTGDGSFGPKTL